ncbi:MAG: histidinol-phosphate aminotransferase family protein [Bacteroidetes bacterium]|nr:histidinol-phosphate aminotransferase family protein [Bacteroidota bacterium]
MNSFAPDSIVSADFFEIPEVISSTIQLDKNEQPEDVSDEMKRRVLNKLFHTEWNRYPAADYSEIESKIAHYSGLQPDNIVLGAGSANIISAMLNYFAINKKRIHIVQPSYTLFDQHCKNYGIAYEPWYLNEELEFDYKNMPELDKNSVLIITSPNNPVGNSIETYKLEEILMMHPYTMVILDNVYNEFCNSDFTSLVKKYNNLIVLRSFSKAFPAAGLRLGYLCAPRHIKPILKSLILPYSINEFSLIFAREILFDKKFMESSKRKVEEMIHNRNKLIDSITRRFDKDTIRVYPSSGNFLLLRVINESDFTKLMTDLEKGGMKVLNGSHFPLLKNTLRVSIGNMEHNELFLRCLVNCMENNFIKNQNIEATFD